MSAGAGNETQASGAWGIVSARCASTLGPSHPDTALALHIGGVLAAGGGNHSGALLLQRRARVGLIASHNGSSSAAERSVTYIRSLLASSEAMVALGQLPRSLRYLNSSQALAAAHLGLAHPLTATARSLYALLAEEDALQQLLSSRCEATRPATGASGAGKTSSSHSVSASGSTSASSDDRSSGSGSGSARSLVCSEACAITAARASMVHYTAAASSWAAMPASARWGNMDYAAFSAHAALAGFRSSPAVYTNASVLEAGALHSLLAGFNAYLHLDVEAAGAAAAGNDGRGLVTGSGAAGASQATAPPSSTSPQILSSLAGSLASLVSHTMAAEGDHTGARAFLASVEAALAQQGAASGALPQRSASALAAEASSLALARAALHAAWHSQLSSGKVGLGEGAGVAGSGSGSGSGSGGGSGSGSGAASPSPHARHRREKTKLLSALTSAVDYFSERALKGAREAGLSYLPMLPPTERAALLLLPPAGSAGSRAALGEASASPAAELAAPASKGRGGGGKALGSGSGARGSGSGSAGAGAGAPGPAVDPYSFDTFLGDGRGYFASQDAYASAQQSAAGMVLGSGSEGGGKSSSAASAASPSSTPASPPPGKQQPAPPLPPLDAMAESPLGPLNSLLQHSLPQVALHYYARVQGLESVPLLDSFKPPLSRLAMSFLRYGILAFDCSFPLPPMHPGGGGAGEERAAQEGLLRFLAGVSIQCGAGPRAGVPPAFLALFNVKGILAPAKHRVLTRAGRAYLEALVEEAEKLGREEWDLVLAVTEEQVSGLRSEKLAKLAGLGLPVLSRR